MRPLLVFSPLYAPKFRAVAELLRGAGEFALPRPAAREELLRVHTADWVDRALAGRLSRAEQSLVELEVTAELAAAHAADAGGTLLACRHALESGVGLHVGGGAHHAFPERGEGYCVFNDLACAVRALQAEGLIERAAIVDLDVHQGNGTAAVFAGDPRVYTFSMHQDGIYPERRVAGSLDVGLPAGTGDEEYLGRLAEALPRALAFRPELVVYQAGVDCAAGDPKGGLALSPEGLARRDAMVRDACRAAGVPVAVTLGGGYGPRAAELHARTLGVFLELGDV